jgi:hypothetical protein
MELVQRNADSSTEGRNPMSVSKVHLHDAGHEKRSLKDVIRAKCIDCCAGDRSEVKKCTATRCALWPYRMGGNPFALPRGKGSQAGLKRTAKLAKNPLSQDSMA